jgi:hypothetical protein
MANRWGHAARAPVGGVRRLLSRRHVHHTPPSQRKSQTLLWTACASDILEKVKRALAVLSINVNLHDATLAAFSRQHKP